MTPPPPSVMAPPPHSSYSTPSYLGPLYSDYHPSTADVFPSYAEVVLYFSTSDAASAAAPPLFPAAYPLPSPESITIFKT